MLIMPAIDLKDGRCVRLRQGEFSTATVYEVDPFAQLRAFASAGAEWVHIVDLDGARGGAPEQHALVRKLAQASQIKLQVGGGVRSKDDAARLLEAGVGRVVVGTAAVREPEAVAGWIEAFGNERICAAFDLRAGAVGAAAEVAIEGWSAGGGLTLDDAMNLYPQDLLRHVLVTDISRDGELLGPNVELIAGLVAERPDLKVQASGGAASLEDLVLLRGAGAAAAIIGRALYERRFTLEDALAC